MTAPHSRPPSMIGAPTPPRRPMPRSSSAVRPVMPSKLSTRSARPLSRISVATVGLSSGECVPTGTARTPPVLQAPVTMPEPSGSKRSMFAVLAPSSCPTSWVTTENTLRGSASLATTVATRRSAACSSASARSSSSSRLRSVTSRRKPDERPFAGGDVALDAAPVRDAQRGRDDQLGQLAADHLVGAVAEGLLDRAVDLDDAALVVHRDDAVERRVEDRGLARVALAQALLGAPALDALADAVAEARHRGEQAGVRLAALAGEELDRAEDPRRALDREAERGPQPGCGG